MDAIYLDFAKALDSVNHNLLLYKLAKFGLKGGTLKWSLSYLTSRELRVRVKGKLSDSFVASSGVPQESSLGPLLFILFINDVTDNLKIAKILIFADDVKIVYQINSSYDQVCLQKDLDLIYKWTCMNKIRLNSNKCKVVSFSRSKTNKFNFNYTIDNNVFENVAFIKDLKPLNYWDLYLVLLKSLKLLIYF